MKEIELKVKEIEFKKMKEKARLKENSRAVKRHANQKYKGPAQVCK